MHITTKFLGEKEIDESKILHFIEGILGFPEVKEYVLFPYEGTPFLLLQAVEKSELCFILMNPYLVKEDYQPEFSSDIADELQLQGENPAVYSLVVIPEDKEKIRINLQAPILINAEKRLARQVILTEGDYPFQFYINENLKASD